MAWSPDGKQIASGSYDTTIMIWDSRSGICQSTVTGHSGWYVFFYLVFLCACVFYMLTCLNHRVRSVAFSPDGKLVASGSDDSTIKIWDISTGHCDSTLTGHLKGCVFFMDILEKIPKKYFLF